MTCGREQKQNTTYTDLDSVAVARTGVNVGPASIAVKCINMPHSVASEKSILTSGHQGAGQ